MHAADAYNAGMQYTLRNIPKKVDQALRRRAREQGRSLNDVALEALALGAGVASNANGEPVRYMDLSDIAGSWVEDPEFDKVIAEQDQIDPDLWR
jgi:plasmid stability protein